MRGWFRNGHPLQRLLHNDLVRKITSDRESLETAKSEDVLELQTRIRVRKELLMSLHKDDTTETNNPNPSRNAR